MAECPVRTVRLPDELVAKAQANPELAGFELSRLLRVGLALAAGHTLPEAIKMNERKRPGPPPRSAERERTGAAA